MIRKINIELIKELVFATVGTFLIACALVFFLEPSNLVTGGVTGLAIIIRQVSEDFLGFAVPIWVTNIVINIPLLIMAVKIKGIKFLAVTLYCTILLTIFLAIFNYFPIYKIESDLFLACIYGGLLAGIGLGFVFKGFATTGGTDLLATIINQKIKYISVSKIIFYLDLSIIILGFFVFGYEIVMYAIISIFITSKTIEYVLEGMHFSKAAFIVSSKPDEIANEIMITLERGTTGLLGKGMYTSNEKTVLLAVVSIKEIEKIKEIIKKFDENSFLIVADVREVLGEGFKSFS